MRQRSIVWWTSRHAPPRRRQFVAGASSLNASPSASKSSIAARRKEMALSLRILTMNRSIRHRACRQIIKEHAICPDRVRVKGHRTDAQEMTQVRNLRKDLPTQV